MPVIPANAKLLLHFDGTDGATTFTDSSGAGKTVTAVGNAQIDTAQKVFGTASGLFDGTGDYLTTADHADWNLGSGDFYVRVRVRFASAPGGDRIFEQKVDDNNRNIMYHSGANLHFLSVSGGSTLCNFAFAWTPSTDTWYDVELSRSGNSWYAFVDGTQIGTTQSNSATLPDLAAPLLIGAGEGGAGGFMHGWFDEFIWVRGTAGHVSNFTVPTLPYGSSNIKTYFPTARASLKKVNGVAIASVNKLMGIQN